MIARALAIVIALSACPGLALAAPRDHASHDVRQGLAAGKPTGPIGVSYELAGEPLLGLPLAIEIRITADAPLTAARLSLRPSEGLRLDAPVAAVDLAQVDASREAVVAVVVTPIVAGVHYLTVVVEGRANGAPQARNLMIPVRLGPAKDLPRPVLKQEPDGRVIRPLRTLETRR